MSNNKTYREIEGYEKALYATCDAEDYLVDIRGSIQYGEDKVKIASHIQNLEYALEKIKKAIGIEILVLF